MAWEGSWVGTGCRWIWESSWQAALLVGLVLIAQRLFGRQLSPKWRYGLWLVVLVRLVVPNLPESRWSCFNLTRSIPVPAALRSLDSPAADSEATPAVAPQAAPSLASDPPRNVDPPASTFTPPHAATPATEQHVVLQAPEHRARVWRLSDWVVFAWVMGVLGVWVCLLLRLILFMRMVRATSRPPSSTLVGLLERCRGELRLRQRVQLLESAAVWSPSILGLWRPVLLLPAGAESELSLPQMRLVFLHELAHCQRRDLWTNALVALFQGLHWFNPVLWYAGLRVRGDMEMACDAHVLHRIPAGDSVAYGETILRCLEVWSAARPVGTLGMVDMKQLLRRRLRFIAGFSGRRRLGWLAAIAATLLTITGLTDGKSTPPEIRPPALPPGPIDGRQRLLGPPRESAMRNLTNPVVDGVVRDLDGKPISGAEVKVIEYFNRFTRPTAVDAPPLRCLSDQDGAWSLRLPEETIDGMVADYERPFEVGKARRSMLGLEVTHPDYAPRFLPLPPGSAPVHTNLLIRLGVFRTLSAQVIDAEGRALPRAQVQASFDTSTFRKDLASGEDGKFVISGIPPGFPQGPPGRVGEPVQEAAVSNLTLSVSAPGCALSVLRVPLDGPGRMPVTIRLEPARTLRLRIVSPEGHPVADAKVALPAYGLQFTTDSQGEAGWTAAPSAPLDCTIQHRFYASTNLMIRAAGSPTVVSLERVLGLTVEVVDAQSLRPVEYLGYELSNGEIGSSPTSPVFIWPKRSAWNDRDRVKLMAHGYRPAITPQIQSWEPNGAPGLRKLRVTLQPTGWISGQVLLPNGRPAASVRVHLLLDAQDRQTQRYLASLPDGITPLFAGRESMVTDADGGISFAPFPPDFLSHTPGGLSTTASGHQSLASPKAYLVVMDPRGYAEAALSQFTWNGRLVLQPGGSLVGRLGRQETNRAHTQVLVTRVPDFRGVLSPRSEDGLSTDGTGRFAITNLVPGEYAVTFPELAGYTTNTTVRPGQTTQLELIQQAIELRGRLVFPRQGPLPWASGAWQPVDAYDIGGRLTGLRPRSGLYAASDPNASVARRIPMVIAPGGSFTAFNVMPGTYDLYAMLGEEAPQGRPSLTPPSERTQGERIYNTAYIFAQIQNPVPESTQGVGFVKLSGKSLEPVLKDVTLDRTRQGGYVHTSSPPVNSVTNSVAMTSPSSPATGLVHTDALTVKVMRWLAARPHLRSQGSERVPGLFDLPDRYAPAGVHGASVAGGMPVARVSKEITVPLGGFPRETGFDYGDITLTDLRRLLLNDPAPSLAGQRPGGDEVRFKDFSGKWRLLCFLRTDSQMCLANLRLVAAIEAVNPQPERFEVLGISLDDSAKLLANPGAGIALPKNLVWAGPWNTSKAAADYGVVAIPEILLVDPEGRIAARHLYGYHIAQTVERALASK